MTTTTVTPTRPIVKLQDSTLAGMGKDDQLFIQYRNQVQAVIILDEAIKIAQMVLRHAAECGITVPEASDDMFRLPPDMLEEEYQGFKPASYIYGRI